MCAKMSEGGKVHTFRLKMGDPGPDGFCLHHVLKFHPGDIHSVKALESEWVMRKDAPKKDLEWERKKEEKNRKKGIPIPVIKPDPGYKQNWLITQPNDPNFLSCFIARREPEKKSCLEVMIVCALTKINLATPRNEAMPGSRVHALNQQLDSIYFRLRELVVGPATNVFTKKVDTKKRDADKPYSQSEYATYPVINVQCRLPSSSIQAIEEEIKNLNAIEKVITVEYKALIADGKYHLNGKMFSYKVLEEGSKQQSYFWVVPGEDRTLDVTSVHGDWWTARKDGMRRGLEAEETEVGGSRVKKTKKGETNAVMDDRFKRLMMKTEEAKIKNQTREEQLEGGKGGASKRRVKVENTGEDQLKVKWREEEHKSDDDMDCQQCGDIDDEDYDNMMAAAGDDLQNDAREEIQDANTEVLPDPDNESSDDDDDKEVDANNEKSLLDKAGKKMNRILRGAPEKKKNEGDSDSDGGEGESSKEKEKKPSAAEVKKKETTLKIKVKAEAPQLIGAPQPKIKIESSSVKRRAPGGGSASTTAGGGEGRDAKRQRKDAPAAAAAAAAPKEITLENLRKAIEDDSEMTVKKLTRIFGVNNLAKEDPGLAKFKKLFMEVAIKTPNVVQTEGEFKGQAIIGVKKKK